MSKTHTYYPELDASAIIRVLPSDQKTQDLVLRAVVNLILVNQSYKAGEYIYGAYSLINATGRAIQSALPTIGKQILNFTGLGDSSLQEDRVITAALGVRKLLSTSSDLIINGFIDTINQNLNDRSKIISFISTYIKYADEQNIAYLEDPIATDDPIATVVKPYQRILNKANNHEFLESILASDPEIIKSSYRELMKYINLSADLPAGKTNEQLIKMILGFVDLGTQKSVREELVLLLDRKLSDAIFDLPTISPEVASYKTLVGDLAAKTDKFQPLCEEILSQPTAKEFTQDMLEYIYSEENDPLVNQKYDKYMASLVNLIQPKVIEKALPLINDQLISNILQLPILNSEKVKEKGLSIKKRITSSLFRQYNYFRNLGKKKVKKDQSKTTHALIGLLRNISKSEELLKIIDSIGKDPIKSQLEGAIDTLFERYNIPIQGKKLVKLLPRILTSKGLDAIANLIDKPSGINYIRLLYKVPALSSAMRLISHAAYQSTKKIAIKTRKFAIIISKKLKGKRIDNSKTSSGKKKAGITELTPDQILDMYKKYSRDNGLVQVDDHYNSARRNSFSSTEHNSSSKQNIRH